MYASIRDRQFAAVGIIRTYTTHAQGEQVCRDQGSTREARLSHRRSQGELIRIICSCRHSSDDTQRLCHSLPDTFLPFENAHPQVSLILAYISNRAGEHYRVNLQFPAVQAARHRNVWVDTSSARSILPNLVESLAKEIGAGHLLFETDTPLYHSGMQRARIEIAKFPDAARQFIQRVNVIHFYGLNDDRLNALH